MMATKPIETIVTELALAADDLNRVSDQLNKEITDINESLSKLNLGIECWFDAGNGLEVGYSRLHDKWGLGIRQNTVSAVGEWPFTSAPRFLRVRAVEFLPNLLGAMVDQATAVHDGVSDALHKAYSFATSIKGDK